MKKKWIWGALTAALLTISLSVTALAANQVKEIAVDVTLEEDGSAYVVQTWRGDFEEGTECYFPVTNLGDIVLSDLTVTGESGTYQTLERWDTGADFDEKAGTCGLNEVSGGYEVCWGITSYGENRYAVEYRLEGLVGGYDDADGFLFQFVPSEMNTGPTDVTVRLHLRDGRALTAENAAIWAFGFAGQIGFADDGGVLAYTEEPITGENSVIVMLQLQSGIIQPARTVGGSFEEVKNRAFEGSDYGEEEGLGWGFWVIAIAVVVALLGVFVFFSGAEGRRIKKVYKTANYYRESPIGGNLEACFQLAKQFQLTSDEGNLVAAALMRLLADGCLEPLDTAEIGFMGKEKKNVSLKLIKAPTRRGLVTEQLYELLITAAGPDGILQENELENYCNRNYQAMMRIIQEAKGDGLDTLDGVGCYKSMLSTNTLAGLTERGRTLLLQLMGLKKFLLDFSLIAERGVNEAVIWQDYITYASLFGIADKVMEQMRKLYPGNVNAYLQRTELTYYVAYRYYHVTYGSAKSAEAAALRSSGGGGSVSIGGGGGFSGGGSGGGTR